MIKKKILLVDDINLSLEMEKQALQGISCTILTAHNGSEALEVAKRDKPDLIVMDLYMPNMNGDKACKILKEDPLLKHIPIIMTCSTVNEKDRERCFEAGCNGFISKPFSEEDFLENIGKHIDVIGRKHTRLPIVASVSYSLDNKTYEGEALNLSESGIFIKAEAEHPVGAELEDILFSLPTSNSPVKAKGKVRWNTESTQSFSSDIVPGVGVQFSEVSSGRIF